MSIAKIETASGVTLVLNGNTVFASDDTSYWLQGAKVVGDDGHVYGHAETIRDALCIVLAKYGGVNYSVIELPSIKRRGLTLDSPRA